MPYDENGMGRVNDHFRMEIIFPLCGGTRRASHYETEPYRRRALHKSRQFQRSQLSNLDTRYQVHVELSYLQLGIMETLHRLASCAILDAMSTEPGILGPHRSHHGCFGSPDR